MKLGHFKMFFKRHLLGDISVHLEHNSAITPVSYTHLDVYKRQECITNILIFYKIYLSPRKYSVNKTIYVYSSTSVSYTHLDVYKRQINTH